MFELTDQLDEVLSPALHDGMARYFPNVNDTFRSNLYAPDSVRKFIAQDMFIDHDGLFDRFMQRCRLLKIAKDANLEMKKKNTIVEPSPMRLGRNSTDRKFSSICSSSHNESLGLLLLSIASMLE